MSVDLTRDHLRLVHAVVRRHFSGCHLEFEDLAAAGMVGLVKASQRWDADRGVDFGVYAWIRIRGAIQDYLRLEDPLSRHHRRLVTKGLACDVATVSLDAVLSLEDSSAPIRRLDQLLDPHDEHGELETRTVLDDAIAQLPERERTALELRYFGDWPLRDIGELLGVSESRVCQLISKAARTLRARVGRDLRAA